jgi:L-ascorbate metabolism protein UlaG (beta-lactamase superfamily)
MPTVEYLGHSCFTIRTASTNLIIDPFLTGNPLAVAKAEEIKADYILVTHGHGDHFGDTIEIAKNNNATVIGPNEIAVFCQNKGVNAHNMHIGGCWDFPFGRVKLTIAHHGFSAGESGLDIGGNPCGFILTMDGKKIYHAGDTALFMDMQIWRCCRSGTISQWELTTRFERCGISSRRKLSRCITILST